MSTCVYYSPSGAVVSNKGVGFCSPCHDALSSVVARCLPAVMDLSSSRCFFFIFSIYTQYYINICKLSISIQIKHYKIQNAYPVHCEYIALEFEG